MVFWVARSESIILVQMPTKVGQMPAERKGGNSVEPKGNFHSIEWNLGPCMGRLDMETRIPQLHSYSFLDRNEKTNDLDLGCRGFAKRREFRVFAERRVHSCRLPA